MSTCHRKVSGHREHKIGRNDCLPKTQLLANTQVVVLEATPAQ